MTKTYGLLLAGMFAMGCADYGAQEKAALDSVIKVHDKVMGEDEQLLKNKAKLDNLVKAKAGIKDSTSSYLNKVVLADSAMDTWMHNFTPDLTGKPHDEKMSYLKKQKMLIIQIDSEMNSAITTSTGYLVKMKK
jgi:hypothetical protein